MANIYDQNVKLQAIADAITNQSITITTGQDLLNALADIANAMQPAAANISYDNTNSGLQAVNVQQAVDENADNISALNSSLNNYIRTAEYTPSISTTANESFSANIDATMQGYTLLGVVGIMLLSGASYVYRLNAVQYNGENNIYISGYSTGTVTISVRVVALYKKS